MDYEQCTRDNYCHTVRSRAYDRSDDDQTYAPSEGSAAYSNAALSSALQTSVDIVLCTQKSTVSEAMLSRFGSFWIRSLTNDHKLSIVLPTHDFK